MLNIQTQPRHLRGAAERLGVGCRVATALAMLLGVAPAHGMFMRPTFVPTERLTKNVVTYLAEHPRDAKAYYNLGRIHYLAFVNESRLVPSTGGKDYPAVAADHLLSGEWIHFERDQLARSRALEEQGVTSIQELDDAAAQAFYDRMAEIYQQLEQENWQPEPLTEAELNRHALAAVTAFQQAIALESDNGLYQLGLASLLETMAQRQADATIRDLQTQMAATRYQLAFDAARENDNRLERIPITGLKSIVSLEAGKAIERIYGERGDPVPANVVEQLQKMQSLERGPITPIVFALDNRPYAELESGRTVAFDLDADGSAKPWKWLRPDIGILVWMPLSESVVTSGAQLFGPFAFHQLWTDGYAALNALDDDRNGRLQRGELNGIRVWFDRDSNGEMTAAEVVQLEELGFESIEVRPHRDADGILSHPTGIQRRNGEAVKTWDWHARPAT
ncbi:MAG: hypothetical protein AAGF97_04730 [Planctomycetota bacterium]